MGFIFTAFSRKLLGSDLGTSTAVKPRGPRGQKSVQPAHCNLLVGLGLLPAPQYSQFSLCCTQEGHKAVFFPDNFTDGPDCLIGLAQDTRAPPFVYASCLLLVCNSGCRTALESLVWYGVADCVADCVASYLVTNLVLFRWPQVAFDPPALRLLISSSTSPQCFAQPGLYEAMKYSSSRN